MFDQFAGLADGAPVPLGIYSSLPYTGTISYLPTAIVITYTPNPEPTTVLAVCAAAAAIGGRMRRTLAAVRPRQPLDSGQRPG